MIDIPPALNRAYNRDPNINKALERGGLLIMGLHYWASVLGLVFRIQGWGWVLANDLGSKGPRMD